MRDLQEEPSRYVLLYCRKETDSYQVVLDGNVRTMVSVVGDRSSDIDCELIDSRGNLVDSDRNDSDTCALAVTPKWQGKFTILIINHGSANEYQLAVY